MSAKRSGGKGKGRRHVGSAVVLVHLSDIHFIRRSGDRHDIDNPIRNELSADATRELKKIGTPSAICITGDISYGGSPGEYEVAGQWLETLRKQIGVAGERIWMVPGNHDVHLPIIDESPMLQTIHDSFRKMNAGDLDGELAKYMRCRDGEYLFSPLRHYNNFAQTYDCHISPDRPCWCHNLTLNDGSTLRVIGMNSTLISSLKDAEGSMILGGEQIASLLREPGVEYLTLCHHPIDWCRNKDVLNRPLSRLPRVLLFGHKHSQDIYRIEDSVRVTSGAVHPYRREPQWRPRYNLLHLKVIGRGKERRLEVMIYPRVWNEASTRFEAELHDDQPYRRYVFNLAVWTGSSEVALPETQISVLYDEPQAASVIAPEIATRPDDILATRLAELPFRRQIAIAQVLNLLSGGEESLPEDEARRAIFRRARDRRTVVYLWNMVEQEHPAPLGMPNPFREAES